MFRHLGTLKTAEDPRTQLAFPNFEQAIGELVRSMRTQRGRDGIDFTGHAKRAVTWELLGYPVAVFGPICGADEAHRIFGTLAQSVLW